MRCLAPLLLVIVSVGGDLVFSVRDYGAVGDGMTDDTGAFEEVVSAIAAAGEQGGTLLVPGGASSPTYLIHPINLTSHLHFHIEDGATVAGVKNLSAWPLIEGAPGYGQGRDHPNTNKGYDPTSDGRRFTSLLHGEHLSDVKISGEGPGSVLDGQGDYWWAMHRSGIENNTRGHLVELMYSTDVELSNLTLKNSPFWTTHFCEYKPFFRSDFVCASYLLFAIPMLPACR